MKMKAYRRLYQSYLLRVWKENHDLEWRGSLQNVATGECHNFGNLSNLFSFLQSQTEELQDHPGRSTGSSRNRRASFFDILENGDDQSLKTE